MARCIQFQSQVPRQSPAEDAFLKCTRVVEGGEENISGCCLLVITGLFGLSALSPLHRSKLFNCCQFFFVSSKSLPPFHFLLIFFFCLDILSKLSKLLGCRIKKRSN